MIKKSSVNVSSTNLHFLIASKTQKHGMIALRPSKEPHKLKLRYSHTSMKHIKVQTIRKPD